MCCFAQPVQRVANTRIFARRFNRDRQYIAYQMEFATNRPNAMILPLPVALPAKRDAVRFISLKEYPTFFTDLHRLFYVATASSRSAGTKSPIAMAAALPVHEVGDFVASFVPTMKDFARLDSRFTIKPAIWKRIPRYADYGFAVFQLKAPLRQATTVHPMAFEFRTRLRDKIFFPTVHIHDGRIHESDVFDHQLYWQGRDADVWTPTMRGISSPVRTNSAERIETAGGPVPKMPARPTPSASGREIRFYPQNGATVNVKRAKGLYAADVAVHRWTIQQTRKNEDILI
jgi:hypothetical protein